jgi:hypothetical protein
VEPTPAPVVPKRITPSHEVKAVSPEADTPTEMVELKLINWPFETHGLLAVPVAIVRALEVPAAGADITFT